MRLPCPPSVQVVGVVCVLVAAVKLQAKRGTDGGLPFPRSVPLFLVVTGVRSRVPGGVGLVVGGTRVTVRARGDAQFLCADEGGTACIAPR